MWESSRGFGWQLHKNVDNAGGDLPPTAIVRVRVWTEFRDHSLSKVVRYFCVSDGARRTSVKQQNTYFCLIYSGQPHYFPSSVTTTRSSSICAVPV